MKIIHEVEKYKAVVDEENETYKVINKEHDIVEHEENNEPSVRIVADRLNDALLNHEKEKSNKASDNVTVIQGGGNDTTH